MNEKLLEETFLNLGFKTLHINKPPSANGADCWIIKDGKKPLSVEIKKARIKANGTIEIEPVCKNRMGDDLIAIFVGEKYLLVEPMKDHLKACSPKGTRHITVMA